SPPARHRVPARHRELPGLRGQACAQPRGSARGERVGITSTPISGPARPTAQQPGGSLHVWGCRFEDLRARAAGGASLPRVGALISEKAWYSVNRRRNRLRGGSDARLPGIASALRAHREIERAQVLLLAAPHRRRRSRVLRSLGEVATIPTASPVLLISHDLCAPLRARLECERLIRCRARRRPPARQGTGTGGVGAHGVETVSRAPGSVSGSPRLRRARPRSKGRLLGGKRPSGRSSLRPMLVCWVHHPAQVLTLVPATSAFSSPTRPRAGAPRRRASTASRPAPKSSWPRRPSR